MIRLSELVICQLYDKTNERPFQVLLFKSPDEKLKNTDEMNLTHQFSVKTDGYWYHFSLSGSHLLFICLRNEIITQSLLRPATCTFPELYVR